MKALKKHIFDKKNGRDYILAGDYYLPDLRLPEETRPIGRWGRIYKDYLEQYHTARYNYLLLSGKLWTYLADLNEQARERMECMITQMKAAEGVTEELKARDSMAWVGAMSNIRSRAEEIILREMIYEDEEAYGLGRIRKRKRKRMARDRSPRVLHTLALD